MSPVKYGCSVCLTCGNYVERNSPEDWKLDGNAENLPRLILMRRDKTLVATVGPSELLGPPGSSLL